MKKTESFLFAGVLVSALCMACGGSTSPEPPEPPGLPEVPKGPQEVNVYYLGDKKTELKILKDRVIVKAASHDEAEILCKNEIFGFDGPPQAMDEYVIASFDPTTTTIEDIRKLPGVLCAAYGLGNGRGDRGYPRNSIFVQAVDSESLENILNEAGLEKYDAAVIDQHDSYFLIKLDLAPEYILWASNAIYETGLCEFAEPAFFMEIEPEGESQVMAGEEIMTFFDNNTFYIGRSIFGEDNEEILPVCIMINSADELPEVTDFDGLLLEYPDIDFDSHTLVLGQWVQTGGRYIASQSLVVENGTATINLITVTTDSGPYPAAVYMESFWGLYPKTDTDSININVTHKNLNYYEIHTF